MSYAQEGWTQVRYGKRQQRPREDFFDGGRGRREPWREARAFPVPRKGVPGFNPPPNRPAPTRGFSSSVRPQNQNPPRYGGPQSRSYASVVRDGNPQQGRDQGQGSRNQGGVQNPQRSRFILPARDQRPTATDPKFGALVRKFYKIIKMVHHLQNVTPDEEQSAPRMISRMVDVLAGMIKPAVPTEATLDLIVGNAKNWGHTTLLILQDHYKDGLDGLMRDLSSQWDPDWKTQFEVACRWARRNLTQVSQEVLDHVEALITSCGNAELEQEGGNKDRGETEEPQQEPELRQSRRGVLTDSQTVFIEEIAVITPDPEPPSTRIPRVISQLGKASKAAQVEEVEDREVPAPDPQPVSSDATHTEAAITVPEINLLLEMEDSVEEPEMDPFAVGQESPKAQRAERRVQIPPSLGVDDTPPQPPNTVVHVAQIHCAAAQESTVEGLLDLSLEDLGTRLASTPKPHKFKPTRHINTERKLVDWGLTVMKKWIILGDSNLCRIPPHYIPDLQIDCYPGANFRHAESILGKATSQVTVEKVVLAFGLNSRNQKAKQTAIKQLQAAVRMTKRTFPYAEIWIPLINYSSSLPVAEKETLLMLNAYIANRLPFIRALPRDQFQTESDRIHWTRDTARAMLDHWVEVLNLSAP